MRKNWKVVHLSKSQLDPKINPHVEKRIQKKLGEFGYRKDKGSLDKRFRTGIVGEEAVQHYLNPNKEQDLNFVDYEVGDSNLFKQPDLRKIGIDCGVKSFSDTQSPLINRNIKKPQIICHVEQTQDNYVVTIYGLFYPRDMKDNLDDELVKDNRVDLKSKSGFNRFDLGVPFEDYDDLKAKCFLESS